MIGPLSSQLNAIKWGEFRLGDLFEMERGTRLTKANRIKGTRPLVTAGYESYGVAEYISNHDQKVFKGNTITIDMFANAFYRYSEYSADDNILVLTPKSTMSYRIGLCVTARINAVLKAKFSYGKQYRQKDFNVTIISLSLKPTAKTQTLKDIDFDFMETFIAELEQCRLAELQAYLKATGLENTTLSNDEENALNVFNNSGNTPCGLTWQSFRLGDLFEVLSSKKIYHANTIKIHDTQIESSYPYVVRATTNNGIKGFIIDDPTFTNEKNTLSFAQDTFTVFYQKQPYFTGNKVKILKPKFAFKSPKILHFISAILQFILKPLTWGLGSTTESIAEFKISLPLKPTANAQSLDGIDFHFMHTLINALMKQTIQGVAQYCNAKIQATKEIISQETPVQKDSLF
ncbi:restriction endonuclease subunit S [Helicobacter pylori]|uniref:restriction endonuclease subunit S n=1 Tax=Helicobacter pylori TaxID=210 RepID=UPI003567E7CF